MLDSKIITLLKLEKAGSYTKAAHELHLTQPAISRHIRLLEEELGIKIFQHGTKKLLPTREGKILLRYAHRLMAISQKAVQAIEDERRHARHLVIGITQTASENMIPQVIAQYCNENPDTHITLITDTINNLYKYLELFEVDIAVTEGGAAGGGLLSIGAAGYGLSLPDCFAAASLCRAAKRSTAGTEKREDDSAASGSGYPKSV